MPNDSGQFSLDVYAHILMTQIFLSLAIVLLTSCATSPVKVGQSRAVPPDRLLAGFHRFAQSSPERAKLVVIRDAGLLGAGARAKLLVDGTPVAILWPGERVEVFVPAGDHILGVVPQPQLLGALIETSSSTSAGRTYHFRISISETSFTIQPTAQFE